jgi:dihydroceramide fatty acyl 2-hydroxylase
MKTMLRTYFTHTLVLCLWVIALSLLFYIVKSHLLQQHWPWFLLAILLAPFLELIAHRYILHTKLPEKDSWYRRFIWRLHHGHHHDPKNIELLFAPPLFVVAFFIQIFILYALLSQSLTTAIVPVTASLIYYLYYEWTHLGHHMAHYQHFTKYGKMMKSAHMRHHYINENYWWGVTNHFADIIFDTYKQRSAVEKSETVQNLSGQQHN